MGMKLPNIDHYSSGPNYPMNTSLQITLGKLRKKYRNGNVKNVCVSYGRGSSKVLIFKIRK